MWSKVGLQHVRLRDKAGAKVGKVYLDDQTLRQNVPTVADGKEVAVQALEAPERATANDVSLFVQRWSPATAKLGPKREVMIFKRATMGAVRAAGATSLQVNESIERQCVGSAAYHDIRGFLLCCLMRPIGSCLQMPAADQARAAKGPSVTTLDATGAAKLKWDEPAPSDAEMVCSAPPWSLRSGDLLVFVDAAELRDANEAAAASGGPAASAKGRGATGAAAAKTYGRVAWKPSGGVGSVGASSRSRFVGKEHALAIYTDEDMAAIEAAMAESAEEAAALAAVEKGKTAQAGSGLNSDGKIMSADTAAAAPSSTTTTSAATDVPQDPCVTSTDTVVASATMATHSVVGSPTMLMASDAKMQPLSANITDLTPVPLVQTASPLDGVDVTTSSAATVRTTCSQDVQFGQRRQVTPVFSRVDACVCVGVQWYLVGLDGRGASPATTAFRFDYRVELQDMDDTQRSQLLASVHCYDTTVWEVQDVLLVCCFL